MPSEGSVTRCIGALQAGDAAAAQQLWERYFHRLVGLARTKLENAPRGILDEDDVALSAFVSFCRGAQEGRFPDLADRDCLWQLLAAITVRKAGHAIRDALRRRPRDGAAVLSDDEVIAGLVSGERDPAFEAQLAEEFERLLSRLWNPRMRAIALGRMEGYTEKELASQLRCTVRTIKRKLHDIRDIWKQEVGQ